ncbi:MAG: recombination mediator RecR [Candidatus Kapabacteria bacterium]|nr:recombination mediator RecR [Candidatus Kapabacteria bacterium]MDW8012624.1 recombination mediator RecR [Bacteroidota bacterium]
MQYPSAAVQRVVELFTSLPGIGRRTALRLTFFLLRQTPEFIESFAEALRNLKQQVRYCSQCFTFTETDPCPICASPQRDRSLLCVVEEPMDVLAIERTGEYRGLYHVLHGVLNPLNGVGPEELKVRELVARISSGVAEVILALSPTVEGDVTAQYLARLLKPLGVRVTRIAQGVPMGSALEFMDEATLSRALSGRHPME